MTHRGKTVFARGYGYADVASGDPVRPESLFRIASISKPVTAVAILQLVEAGKLKLEDKWLNILDYSKEIEALGEVFDVRLRDITIGQLLEHRGGWDRGKSFDAMFQSVRFAKQQGVEPPAAAATVIEAMLSVRLDFDPGERYAYSNLGYCILGRVIEKLSGKGYEEYVRQNVLAPLGATTMRLGATRLAQRAEGEVRYYHPGQNESVFASDLGKPVPPP